LINWIGRQTEAVILAVNEESRLAVAILLILWVSALASAFVDNIPLTTMMIRIVINLNQQLDLPLQPLVWALAFGACLGGQFFEVLKYICSREFQVAIQGIHKRMVRF
jgi:Na+/H+ antiporter NhaD/arsenite permease-like protein